jgi:hypothetical protein
MSVMNGDGVRADHPCLIVTLEFLRGAYAMIWHFLRYKERYGSRIIAQEENDAATFKSELREGQERGGAYR